LVMDRTATPTGPVRIEVQGLAKVYPTVDGGDKRAVDGVSFRVHAGEIYGLLGPNGAGKTTTLRILSGLISATEGTVWLNGFDVESQKEEVKRSIGFLNATTGLYQRLSAEEVLTYFARLNGLDKLAIRRRVEELSQWLEMGAFLRQRCGSLSTGQRQRVSIARALVADPPVLILDEPTLGLDVISNRLVLDFVRQEADRGKCIVLSTHYLDEAETICGRLGLMYQGKLIAEGTLDELRETSGKQRLSDIFLTLCGEDRRVLGQRANTLIGGSA
jgi:sodium transport system ATP-binding protein